MLLVEIPPLMHRPLQILAVVAVPVAITRQALHVLQLHRQDMLLLTLAVEAVLVVTTLRGMRVWHLQKARAMLSFRTVAVVPVATIHLARVALPIMVRIV